MGAFCVNDRFYRGDATLFDSHIYFGIDSINQTESSYWNRATSKDLPIFDENFDGLESYESQMFLLNLCNDL